jgi:hypothetical protein
LCSSLAEVGGDPSAANRDDLAQILLHRQAWASSDDPIRRK